MSKITQLDPLPENLPSDLNDLKTLLDERLASKIEWQSERSTADNQLKKLSEDIERIRNEFQIKIGLKEEKKEGLKEEKKEEE